MDTIIVIIIVAAAAAYLIKSFFKTSTHSGNCSGGCGCTSCPPSADCRGAED